ncbi:hypothetical protein [Streptomyces sp. NPDC056682]|uniref:hypothetical protein n=1 Tax=Streptomyces sp. NPDC056682 TaxID=3345909 RepID=UPI0036A8A169
MLHSRDTSACATTYAALLGWPVALGHRYRRGPGCTCDQVCATPGAHPRRYAVTPVPLAELSAAFDAAPGAGIIAPCASFDAVVMPQEVGMALMLRLDAERIHAPCLTAHHQTATLLVAPGTGKVLVGRPSVEVRTGTGMWVALPPSHGVRWDTTPTPDHPLPDTCAIRPHLVQVLSLTAQERDR